jgi:hypothetical protein
VAEVVKEEKGMVKRKNKKSCGKDAADTEALEGIQRRRENPGPGGYFEEVASQFVALLWKTGGKHLSSRQCHILHRRMWAWLAANPGKPRTLWPWWQMNGGPLAEPAQLCYACVEALSRAYAHKCDAESQCEYCPLAWPGGLMCRDSLYREWRNASLSNKGKLALQIAELEWREDV